MSKTSNWPLSPDSTRLVSPVIIREQLQQHPLTQDCYPLAIGRYEKSHGHQMVRNRHDDNLIIYCFSGKGHLKTKHWQGEVNPGEIILLPAGVNHQYKADREDPWSIYWCHFSGERATDYIYNMDYRDEAPTRAIPHPPNLLAQFSTVLAQSSSGFDTKGMVYATNMLKQLLAYIGKLISEKNNNIAEFDIHRIQTFMLQNLDKSIDLEALAEATQLSKFYFSKKYKQTTGHSPIKHFLTMKIQYASYLLETSEMSIQDIANRVGYEDALYFSRLFRKSCGLSPAKYRRVNRNS